MAEFGMDVINNVYNVKNGKEVGFHIIDQDFEAEYITKKFDSGASRCMSGVEGRIDGEIDLQNKNISIEGFNSNRSDVKSIGYNEDSKPEYYVPDMPKGLVLLAAHEYAKDGAAVLMANSGKVMKLSPEEKAEFLSSINKYEVVKRLIVKNRTYEVHDRGGVIDLSDELKEEGLSASATKYFNSKVNVSSKDERILSLLLSGLSFKTLKMLYKEGEKKMDGLPRDICEKDLNKYEKEYGTNPEILQQAIPNLAGNVKGYLSKQEPLSYIGQRVEADYLIPEFNENQANKSKINEQVGSLKIPTVGGAISAYLAVDCYSGYPIGYLCKSVGNSVEMVKRTVEVFNKDQPDIKIKTYAADQGILTQSEFQVIVPEVQAYLNKHHNNGLTMCERMIRSVKELIRFAMLYILNNPNFPNLGFTRRQIFQLWGELFYWSLWVIRFKKCPNVEGKTRYEVWHKEVPDLRKIRLLPIFAILFVLRHSVKENELGANRVFWQRGLYVGPSSVVNGAIRVAVRTRKGHMKIVVSTRYKGVSDGGRINNIYHIDIKHIEASDSDISPTDESKENDEVLQNLPDEVRGDNTPNVELRRSTRIANKNIVPEEPRLSHNPNEEEVQEKEPKECKKARKSRKETSHTVSEILEEIAKARIEIANSTLDWVEVQDEEYYFNFSNNMYYNIDIAGNDESKKFVEEGYRAVTENVPRSITKAMSHPRWGEPTREELSTITDKTGTLVPVDTQIALTDIKNGANCLTILLVFEEKIKEGRLVDKVRMVADGRSHTRVGSTYSPTPSREEFLILMHLCAVFGWNYYWLDENRAFLSADRNDKRNLYAKFPGDYKYYLVAKALYGTKDAPRDYNIKVEKVVVGDLGFERLQLCNSLYITIRENNVVVVYDHVDDFIFTGDDDDDATKFNCIYNILTPTIQYNCNFVVEKSHWKLKK